ncbi:hypothetical protein ACEWY4_000820 [Coilia grayii]|uniref:Adenylate cyclase N-terminal domain-containing protein n=1 Tax=Coilia grayii TaxID=363190 RepID=A0ABD1KXT2_9TELE
MSSSGLDSTVTCGLLSVAVPGHGGVRQTGQRVRPQRKGRGREKTTGERYLTFVALGLLPLVPGARRTIPLLNHGDYTEGGSLVFITWSGFIDSKFTLKEERDANDPTSLMIDLLSSHSVLLGPKPQQGWDKHQNPYRMSWFNGFLVARVDDRKTAWGERNGKKSKRKGTSSLCNPRYMSCLRDAEAMEPPVQAPQPLPQRGGGGAGGLGGPGTVGGGSQFGVRCGWQEDHYGIRGGAGGGSVSEGVGLKSVHLDFGDGRKGGSGGGGGGEGSGVEEDEDDSAGGGVVTAADCWQRVARVFQSKKFQSRKLERLYQRYFFRLNQSSLTMLMGVLVLVCGVMLAFHCVHAPPHPAYAALLSVAMGLFLALMVVCNRNGFHQDYMWMVSYLVIGVLLLVQCLGVLMVAPRSASEGIWWSVFFIYIIYTLLPVRMRAAVISGGLLSCIHLLVTWRINLHDHFLWKQEVVTGDSADVPARQMCSMLVAPDEHIPTSPPKDSYQSPKGLLPDPQITPTSPPKDSYQSPKSFLPDPQSSPTRPPNHSDQSPKGLLPDPQNLPL